MKKIPQKYRKKRESKRHTGETTLFLRGTLGTLLLSLAVGGGFLLLFSLVLTFTPDPLSLVLPMGLLTCAITALMGGFFATRIYHFSPLGAGLINGILLTALSLLFSLLFIKNAALYATAYTAVVSTLLHAGVVGLSIVGAFWGGHKPMPNKHRKKKLKR